MKRILVIDDDLETCNFLTEIFAEEGWELLPALDGTHHGEYSVLMRRFEKG